MVPEPRRHHYVTESFLAGFTESGSRSDMLWVHDLKDKRRRQQRPNQVAHERDFYRVEITGNHPLMVEDAYAELEGRAMPVVREIEATHELPPPERLKALLGFVAHQTVRVPHHRRWLSDAMSRIAKLELEMSAGTPELFAERVEGLKSQGVETEGLTHEHVREVIDSDAFSLEPPQSWLVAHAVVDGERVFQCLVQRNWGIQVADEGLARFIASDNPVALVPVEQTAMSNGWGWATPGTAAIVPISKRIVLVGTFEPLPWGTTRILDTAREVALINGFTVLRASRFVFSAGPDFIWTKSDGRVGHASDLTT